MSSGLEGAFPPRVRVIAFLVIDINRRYVVYSAPERTLACAVTGTRVGQRFRPASLLVQGVVFGFGAFQESERGADSAMHPNESGKAARPYSKRTADAARRPQVRTPPSNCLLRSPLSVGRISGKS